MPQAISSEPPPMSSTSSRPADQPNQRRAARNVSRASSSPESTRSAVPVAEADPLQHLLAVARLAHRGGGERQDLLDALVLRHPQRVLHLGAQRRHAAPVDGAVVVQQFRQAQFGLVRVGRQRPCPGVGVHHEQVHGVGPDVEHTESHGHER